MASFTLTIDMDNAVFEDDPGLMLGQLLAALATKAHDGSLRAGDSGNLRDPNGNTVGKYGWNPTP